MKELEVYIVPGDLSKIYEILDKHNVVAGVTNDVQGFGRLKRKEIREVMTSRMFTPQFEKRTHIRTSVPDSTAKEIAEEILNSLGESEPRGVILVKEISHANEIGTKKSGDSVLTTAADD